MNIRITIFSFGYFCHYPSNMDRVETSLLNRIYTLATWCKELAHWKRPWCWERLKAGGEGDDRGWDGWMASLTRWTWVWANSRRWWWTGRPGVLQSMELQIVGHDWVTEQQQGFSSTPETNCSFCQSARYRDFLKINLTNRRLPLICLLLSPRALVALHGCLPLW